MKIFDAASIENPGGLGRAGAEPADRPWCPGCGTDEFLIYEEYVTPRFPSDGGPVVPGSAGYSCSVCGVFAAHAVPADWIPPHWFWYSSSAGT